MGIFDDLLDAFGKAGKKARDEAGKAAARAAADQAKRRMEGALDGLVGDAEAELEKARAEHDAKDKLDLPVGEVETPGWARQAAEDAAPVEEAAPPSRPSAQDREAKARAELAALKAKLGKE